MKKKFLIVIADYYSDISIGLLKSAKNLLPKSSIIKTKLKNSGMIINYTINTQNLLAEYIIEGLNFKVQGICNRV